MSNPALANEIAQLERDLAYGAARADIECHCRSQIIDGVEWYDLNRPMEDDDPHEEQWIARAARYLTLRNLLTKHPDQPGLVRPLDQAMGAH